MQTNFTSVPSFESVSQKDNLVVLFTEDIDCERLSEALPQSLIVAIQNAKSSKFFRGKKNEQKALLISNEDCQTMYLLGLGAREKLENEVLRRIGGKTGKYLKEQEIETANILFGELDLMTAENIEALSLGIGLGSYEFKKYKTTPNEETEKQVETVDLNWITKLDLKPVLQQTTDTYQATNFARDLANTAGNHMTPLDLENHAKEIAASSGQMKLVTLDEEQMRGLGMEMFLGVSKGSEIPGRMLFLEYMHPQADKTLAIVGKGITFDTGGISLKPGKSMDEMKFDMCGAAAVLATMGALSKLQPQVNVIGVVAAAENMPDGKAQKPGDIVKAYNGKTVEILNTDAEGRLVLGDALSYTAEKYKPDCMVDLATLTGACIVALGHQAMAAISNNDELCEEIIASGKRTGERVWPLPNFPEYKELLKGKYADLQNIGPAGDAGTITAGLFLEHFVQDTPWVHLDIAGTSWGVKGVDYQPANGATGSAVRLLIDWIQSNQAKH